MKRTITISATTTSGGGCYSIGNSNSRIRPYSIISRRSCSGDCMSRLFLLRQRHWPIRVDHNSQPTKFQYSNTNTIINSFSTSIYFNNNDTRTTVHTTTGASTTSTSISPTTMTTTTDVPSMQIPLALTTPNATANTTTTATNNNNNIHHTDSMVAIESVEIRTEGNDNNVIPTCSNNNNDNDTLNSSMNGIPSKTMISDSIISNATNVIITTKTVASVSNETSPPQPPPPPVPQQQQQSQKYYTSVRLNKYMVLKQYAMSRRDADFFIQNGWIKVNGEIVSNQHYNNQIWMSSSSSSSSSSQLLPLENIDPSALLDPVIEMLPPAIQFQQRCRSTTVIFNKPLGIVSGLFGNSYETSPYQPAIQLLTYSNMYRPPPLPSSSPPNRSTLHKKQRPDEQRLGNNTRDDHNDDSSELNVSSSSSSTTTITTTQYSLPEPYRLSKLAVAGRLDINTTGLLLFTQDGHIASQIIGPQSDIEKEYLVRLLPPTRMNYDYNSKYYVYDPEKAMEELQERVEQLRRGIQCGDDFLEAKSVDILHTNTKTSTVAPHALQLRFILTQGKKHHIRRMMEGVQYQVQALKRVRIGNITLGSLPTGKWRYIHPNERV